MAGLSDMNDDGDNEVDEEPGEVIESAPPQKVGEERQVSNSGLKKKLLKRGVGWETPEFNDQVTGILIIINHIYITAPAPKSIVLNFL